MQPLKYLNYLRFFFFELRWGFLLALTDQFVNKQIIIRLKWPQNRTFWILVTVQSGDSVFVFLWSGLLYRYSYFISIIAKISNQIFEIDNTWKLTVMSVPPYYLINKNLLQFKNCKCKGKSNQIILEYKINKHGW